MNSEIVAAIDQCSTLLIHVVNTTETEEQLKPILVSHYIKGCLCSR